MHYILQPAQSGMLHPPPLPPLAGGYIDENSEIRCAKLQHPRSRIPTRDTRMGIHIGYRERTRYARPEFTSLMYVLGGDRSLSHELLIVRRHNSPRVSHPLSVLPLPLCHPPPPLAVDAARAPARSSPVLCTSALEIRACARSSAVTDAPGV